MKKKDLSPRERLVAHVHELERLVEAKQEAAAELAEAFKAAQREGFDPSTLKVVLKLRQMTPYQRRQRRALESIYLASLGMLEGNPLPDEARRRLDGLDQPKPEPPSNQEDETKRDEAEDDEAAPPPPPEPMLPLKTPDEARQEGRDAAAAGQRVYDNPYPAGDPCRAAWDEGWCSQNKAHGMEPPAAYQRRTEKKPPPPPDGSDGEEKGEPE